MIKRKINKKKSTKEKNLQKAKLIYKSYDNKKGKTNQKTNYRRQ